MIHKFLRYARLMLLIGGLPWSARGTGLSISPNVVTNDYFGPINLTISGVSGQTVLVEKFYDLNGNGVVDAGDLLMQSFRVTDGLIPTVGGVTNLNVPGDADGAVNGQILVSLNYPGLDSIYSRIEGSWLYRVSSVSNAFTPVTQPFQVRQKVLPLFISGVVSDGVSWLTNALVVAYDSNFAPVAGARVQGSGRYTMYVPAGDYVVWPMLNGYVCDQSGGFGSVMAGRPVTNANIQMTAGSTLLSGKVKDSATGVGLAGVGITAYQGTNSFATAFTDTNGNYSLTLTPDDWQVDYCADQMPLLGYVAAAVMPSTNLTGDATGFDIAATRATALIYGTISDDQVPSANLTNVTISAQDVAGLYTASGMAYRTNGSYVIGVVVGNWWIEPDTTALQALGYLGAGTNWVTRNNQPSRINIVGRKVTAHLRGTVSDGSGFPPSYATVQATDATGRWRASSTTDLIGQFDLGVFAGTWILGLDQSTALDWFANGPSAAYAVTDGQALNGLIYRMRYSTADVLGTILDEMGAPVAGVAVNGLATNLGIGYTFAATTDKTGSYYANAANGPCTLSVKCFGSDSLTLQALECTPNTLATLALGSNYIAPILVAHWAAPRFSNPALLPGGTFTTQVRGPTNRTFQVFSSSNLTDWSTIFVTNPAGGQFWFFSTNAAVSPPLFLRALAQ
jgi:hypothetical protein